MNSKLVFLFSLIYYVSAKPNDCCPNGATIVNRRCPNGTLVWSSKCPKYAYAVEDDEFTINNNDTLILGHVHVYKERYCLGTLESENETMALICFPEETDDNRDYGTVKFICCSISIVSLILTLIVYSLIPALRDLQGKCLISNIFSLLMALIFLTVIQTPIQMNSSWCVSLASMLYFWFNGVFFWSNVITFNLWCGVVFPKFNHNRKNLYLMYNLYGWGFPVVLTTIALTLQHTAGDHIQPGFAKNTCWFESFSARWAYFYGPISIILLVNIAMFLSTIISLARASQYISEKKHRSHKFKCILYFKLFTVMGICWIFEPMSDLLYVEGQGHLWLATDIINSLQGFLIFLLLVVFRKRVRRDLANVKISRNPFPKEWATIPDCEELEEEEEQLSLTGDNKNNTTI